MKQIKHLILTPFNFTLRKEINPLTDEWMERRLKIFLNITYLSIMSQTVMDFEWIVGLDYRTPQKWKKKINEIEGITTVYPRNPQTAWPRIVRQYTTTDYLLTTRIDSDDAFSRNAIERIQAVAIPSSPPRFINFTRGLVTDGKKFSYLFYESNPFLSRLESTEADKVESVRCIDHTLAHRTRFYQEIGDKPPLWLVYIHELNCKWTIKEAFIRGFLRRTSPAPLSALENFDVNLEIKE